MIDDVEPVAVEALRQEGFGHREAERIAAALSERSGRDFDTRRVAVFGMAGRLRTPLAELLQVFEREIVARQIEQCVLQDACVAGR